MRLILLFYFLPLVLSGQNSFEGPWTLTYGASSDTLFRASPSINIQYTSPNFRWYEEGLSESEERRLDKYKNMQIVAELLYTPPLDALCMGFYLRYRFLKYKKLNIAAYGGPKFFFIPGDFRDIKYLKGGKQMWFVDMGLNCQLNFKILSPFVDLGVDGILTVGTTCNFRSIYKSLKKRYHLRTRKD